MATNGIISIIKNGKTIFKCVAGCDGMEAPKAVSAIRKIENPTIDQIYKACLDNKFGCKNCLVVQAENDHRHVDMEDDLDPLYTEKFSDPFFNPRWKHGTAAHIEIIEMDKQSMLKS